MRSQNFGIEIEMTGLTRAAAAQLLAGYFGTQATHVGGSYDAYTVRDTQNRQWKLVSDASIRCFCGEQRTTNFAYSVELVSPICQYADIETLQETNQQLIATLDEVVNIQNEGAQRRREAEVELGRIEGELKQKLLELRG